MHGCWRLGWGPGAGVMCTCSTRGEKEEDDRRPRRPSARLAGPKALSLSASSPVRRTRGAGRPPAVTCRRQGSGCLACPVSFRYQKRRETDAHDGPVPIRLVSYPLAMGPAAPRMDNATCAYLSPFSPDRAATRRARRGPGEERQPVFCPLGHAAWRPREERPNRE